MRRHAFPLPLFLSLICGLILVSGCDEGSQSPPPRSNPGPRSANPGPRGEAYDSGPSGMSNTAGRNAGGSKLFTLPMIDGHQVTVKGPAALFFYTSWCGYCKQALPEVNRLSQKARAKGWWVYGIQVQESAATADMFVRTYQPSFPVLVDQSGSVSNQFGVNGFPTFVLIDQTGKVIYNSHSLPSNF